MRRSIGFSGIRMPVHVEFEICSVCGTFGFDRGRLSMGRVIQSTVALLLIVGLTGNARAEEGPGPAKILGVLGSIERSMKATRYQHKTVVRPAQGQYFFDCSGMAQWVLHLGAPQALGVVGRHRSVRPLAVDYYNYIAKIPPATEQGNWYRVPDAASARPGDVIAWVRPSWLRSSSTGHVAFVVSPPRPNTGAMKGQLMRVADASRFHHEDDTRTGRQSGFGTGIMLLTTDSRHQPLGYGWYGSVSTPETVANTKIVIGRPLR